MKGHGWSLRRCDGEEHDHLFPVQDFYPHCYEDCWCCPELDEDDQVIRHNAADRRELWERGERRLS